MSKENEKKVLESVIVTLTILLPRFPDPYRGDIQFCIDNLKELKKEETDYE